MASFSTFVPDDVDLFFDQIMNVRDYKQLFIDAITSESTYQLQDLLSNDEVIDLINTFFIVTYFENGDYRLIKYTSDFEQGTRDTFLINPLLAACFLDRPEHAKLLVERGADVNMRVKKFGFDRRTRRRTGRIETYDPKTYIDEPTDESYEYGMTPLNVSCSVHADALIVYLLSLRSVNPNLENAYGFVPFFTPIYHGTSYYLFYFLNSGRSDINVFECNGWNPLHQLAMHSLSDGVKELLSSEQYANYVPSKDDIDACHDQHQTDAGLCERWILFKIWSRNPKFSANENTKEFYTEYRKRFNKYKALFSQSRYSGPMLHVNHAMRTELTRPRGGASASSAAGSAQRRRVESQVSLNDVPVDPLRIVGQFAEIPNRYSYKLFLFCADQEEDNDDTLAENSPGDRN